MEKANIKVPGHRGTWCVIGKSSTGVYNLAGYGDRSIYLLESEQHGDEWPCLIVDRDLQVIMDDVHDGFSSLYDL